jgi:hypothetical protein
MLKLARNLCWVLFFALNPGIASSQPIDCSRLAPNRPTGVVFEDSTRTPLGTSEDNVEPLTFRRPTIDVCIPVDPGPGAVNIRFQIYTTEVKSDAASADVEFQSDSTAYQTRRAEVQKARGDQAYPIAAIQDYQNYHGCADPDQSLSRREPFLYRDFHVTVNNERSDALNRRTKFLFRKDILPSCALSDVTFLFLDSLPGFGPTIAEAFGHVGHRIDKIVARRSILVRYDFTNKPLESRYVSYVLPPLDNNRCVRIEVVRVYDDSSRSETAAFACSIQTD